MSLSLLAGISTQRTDSPRPRAAGAPTRSAAPVRLRAAHARHPLGTSWSGGYTVLAHAEVPYGPGLRVRCACGRWEGDVPARSVEQALSQGATPKCQGCVRDDERAEYERTVAEEDVRILAAYDKLVKDWSGTRRTLYLAVIREAGFQKPPGFENGRIRVARAIKARLDKSRKAKRSAR